jgi:citrate lyase subunit beta/citryl-CoA lyase
MLAKARELPADEIVIDLEDAVAPDRKDEARALVAATLAEGGWGSRAPAVRINGVDTPHWRADVEALAAGRGRPSTLVVPKAESAAGLAEVAAALDAPDPEAAIGLQALIETATGLARVHAVAAASPRLQGLIVGYADLAASLGADVAAPYPGDRWHAVRTTVLVAARAEGLQAIDGPYLQIADLAGLRDSAAQARALGYDGAWAIHPSQLEPLNEVFTPSPEAFARAVAVLDALAAADREGAGAVALGGEMLDEASRKLAARVVAAGDAAGLRR